MVIAAAPTAGAARTAAEAALALLVVDVEANDMADAALPSTAKVLA